MAFEAMQAHMKYCKENSLGKDGRPLGDHEPE